MSNKLTDELVLRATSEAVRPMSGYIYDQVRGRGASYHPFTRDAILRRLRSLEKKGYLECASGPYGYYGFQWKITGLGLHVLHSAQRSLLDVRNSARAG